MQTEAGPVEYAESADGITVAYQRRGQGPPIVRIPSLPLVLRAQPLLGQTSRLARLSPSASVITWDPRGTGMSDSPVTDMSVEAWAADAEAIIEAVGPPLPVYASSLEGPIALLLAYQRPDLVSHLILSSTGADGQELAQIPTNQAMVGLQDLDWDLFLNCVLRVILRLEHDVADDALAVLHEEVQPAVMRETRRSHANTDVSDLVPDLEVPALVLDRRDNRALMDLAAGGRALSRLIPGAQLVQTSDRVEMDQLILEFLHQEPTEALGAFRTIMFTDLVSSTAMTQRIGDDAAQRVVETHDACVQQALSTHAGTMVKHTGDGIMAAFISATEAAQAAREIVATLSSAGVGVRIGLNAGEPVERNGDFFGTAVQLASRLGDAAEESQVLATQVVRDLTAGKGLDWMAASPIAAKGFDGPIEVFSLRIPDTPPT